MHRIRPQRPYPATTLPFVFVLDVDRDKALAVSEARTWTWLRSHVFRIWTAAAVLAAYAYAWVDRPELLTWWKRTTERAIEWACGLLPYPWNDRVEATLGNFGLWVQITLAIIAFRIAASLLAGAVRAIIGRGRAARGGRTHPPS